MQKIAASREIYKTYSQHKFCTAYAVVYIDRLICILKSNFEC